jgi:hypothetical protein
MNIGDAVIVLLNDVEFDAKFAGYEDIDVEEDGVIVLTLKDNPKFELASGDIVYGYECWWIPKEDVK